MSGDSRAALYEFFAGGGLARLGLEPQFRCAFANDNDPLKAAAYRKRFGDGELRLGDVWRLESADLPGRAALAWASFPCQEAKSTRAELEPSQILARSGHLGPPACGAEVPCHHNASQNAH
jgi:DNA (cytosine-5)-methyltransferase 1